MVDLLASSRILSSPMKQKAALVTGAAQGIGRGLRKMVTVTK
jgi:hypothetical protein